MKRPGPGGGQQSDPTIELSDSELLPMSARKVAAAAAAKKQQDVSLWRGEVVASDDFVPARKQRGVRPWLIVALIGAIGVAGVTYALTRTDDAPSTAPPPPGSASAGSGSAAVTTPPDAAPDAEPKPVDAAPPADAAPSPDAGVAPDAAPAKPTVKKKTTTKKKKATSSKKKKKRPAKKRRSR